MKEKILEVLKKENRKLNPKEILDIIKPNNTREDLADIWALMESMCREGILRTSNGNTYFYNDLLVGKVDLHEKGNAHVLIKDHHDVFIRRDLMNYAQNGDTVSVLITNEEKNEGKIVRVLNRSLGRAIGEVIDDNGHYYVKSLDETLPYRVEVDLSDVDFNLVDGLLVHLKYERDLNKGTVLAKPDFPIKHKNAADKDSMAALIAAEHGIRLDFPKEVLEEAKQIRPYLTPEEIEEELKRGRIDLRGETIFTIDGKDTKDIDDAINNEMLPNGNYLETTAIADVSHYVKMGSAIWQYAEENGNSHYLGDIVGPMLPVELSNGICSLNPNEDRFSVTVQYELDHAGNIINPNVIMTVIKSKQKMNYDAVQDIIEGKYTEETVDYTTLKYTVKEGETIDDIAFKYAMTKEELLNYPITEGKPTKINDESDFVSGNEVNIPTRKVVLNNYTSSKIMRDAFYRRGKCDFDKQEPKYHIDQNGDVSDISPRIQREAERLIENKMLKANEAFTMFMVDKLSKIVTNMIPFVFRTHESPNPKKIQEFLDMLTVYGIKLPFNVNPENVSSKQLQQILEYLKDLKSYSAFSDKLLRCLQKARYTTTNYGHYAIASKAYCHFTSPIRRMADLLVHTIYKVFVVEKDHTPKTLRFWGEYLDRICEQISMCEVESEKLEYDYWDYLNAKYMSKRIGTIEEATVDGIMPSGFFARTDKLVDGKVDFFLTEADARELLTMSDPEEISIFVEKHKKVFSGFYDYNEKMYGYSRNGKMYLRYGDRVLVCCIAASPEKRQTDFALIRKA